MSTTHRPSEDEFELDPVYLHCRREALVMLGVWATCLVWTIGYCSWSGYVGDGGPIPLLCGAPRWVVLGVGLPWLLSGVASIAVALRVMADDDLAEDAADGQAPGEHRRE
jgi:hypothetical protein